MLIIAAHDIFERRGEKLIISKAAKEILESQGLWKDQAEKYMVENQKIPK
jgi:hypothetical protein